MGLRVLILAKEVLNNDTSLSWINVPTKWQIFLVQEFYVFHFGNTTKLEEIHMHQESWNQHPVVGIQT